LQTLQTLKIPTKMKKTLVLSISLFCAAYAAQAQQQKSTTTPKVVKATKIDESSVPKIEESQRAPKAKVSSPEKMDKRMNSKPQAAPAVKPDPRLRVKKSKPEVAKPAVKASESK
jgi:hypothetical protein